MLTIVATPIGNFSDITLRAKAILAECDILIGEEHRATSTMLKKCGLNQREIYLLNEHTKKNELDELVELCKTKNVVLVSDCGTPVFCDPGSDLIRRVREQNIPITSVPGASSLMTLLSLPRNDWMIFILQVFYRLKRLLEKHACKIFPK